MVKIKNHGAVNLPERKIHANIFDESIISINVMLMARKIRNTCP